MKKIVIILVLLLTVGCSEKIEYKTISKNEVFNEIADTIIIDVRSVSEYKEGHIESSINIPVEKIDTIDIEKNEKIIVYCRSGNRSKAAANKLIEMGYKNVYDAGGLDDWKYDLVGE